MSGRQPTTWWWTPTKFSSRCHNCGNVTPAGWLIAWNSDERRALCEVCVEALGLDPATSKRATARRGGNVVSRQRKPKTRAPNTPGGIHPHTLRWASEAEQEVIRDAISRMST